MRVAAWGLAIVLAQFSPATAADPVEVRYEVFWGGFHAAQAQVIRAPGDSRLAVQATGLMESLSSFVLEAETRQQQFTSQSRSQRMESAVEVDFTGPPRTIIDHIRRTDGEESEPRPPVPEGLKAGTLDPLSALMQASERALAAAPGEAFAVPVFDGRNRYDVRIEVVGPKSATVTGRHIDGIGATLEFKPLAGFRPRSLEMWDGAKFNVLLDPDTGLPARIVSESFTVGTVISAVPLARKAGG